MNNELTNDSANLSNWGVTGPSAMILGDKLYAYNGSAHFDSCSGWNDVDDASYVLKSIQLTDDVAQLKKARWTKFQWGPPDLLSSKHFLMAPLSSEQVFIYFQDNYKKFIIFDVAQNEILDERTIDFGEGIEFGRCFATT